MAQEHTPTQPMTFCYEPDLTTWQSIHTILKAARETRVEDRVARHLVGANLQRAFPNFLLRNESGSTGDDEIDPGDFRLGDTDFHVTVTLNSATFETYKHKTQDSRRIFILVPDRILAGARVNAETVAPGRIAVESIESFIGQAVDELSAFSKNQLIDGFRRLIETYNQRVDAVENDKSMLIEIPQSLLR